jgi:hypothetical protein
MKRIGKIVFGVMTLSLLLIIGLAVGHHQIRLDEHEGAIVEMLEVERTIVDDQSTISREIKQIKQIQLNTVLSVAQNYSALDAQQQKLKQSVQSLNKKVSTHSRVLAEHRASKILDNAYKPSIEEALAELDKWYIDENGYLCYK